MSSAQRCSKLRMTAMSDLLYEDNRRHAERSRCGKNTTAEKKKRRRYGFIRGTISHKQTKPMRAIIYAPLSGLRRRMRDKDSEREADGETPLLEPVLTYKVILPNDCPPRLFLPEIARTFRGRPVFASRLVGRIAGIAGSADGRSADGDTGQER